ncbi:hypothetical protein [Leucobacter sp. wl10]|nr:hypothetical protein [Leucobacter sp. wl10]
MRSTSRGGSAHRVGFHGLTSHDGGTAEFTTVDASTLHLLTENVDLRMGR